jgi:DNA-binding response OmpR family regulator
MKVNGGIVMTNILIIEDNNEINNLLSDLLKENYQIFQSFSGTEGLLIFKNEAIDLVLLDIMLPGKTGDQVLKEIRELSDTPVIMLTALDNKEKVSQYLLNGANDYVTKPFNLEELLARITVQLRQKKETVTSKTRSIKNITLINEEFSVVHENGSKIRLSKIEFDILSLLINHPKQIFTKEQLFEKIWNEPYFSGDNTINTHLSNLRKKLAKLDPETEYIETIWGLGIRLKGTDI